MSTIEEVADNWGSFELQLDPDTPSSIHHISNPQLYPTVIVRVYPFEITKDQIEENIASPIYSGVIRSSSGDGEGGRTLGGVDGSFFLGEPGGGVDVLSLQLSDLKRGPMSTNPDDAINFYGSITGDPDNIYQGLLVDWINAILLNSKSGIEAGFVGGPTTQKVSGFTYAAPPRALLDGFIKKWFTDVMWRMGPDLKLYVGYQSELWPATTPAPLAVRKGAGSVDFRPLTMTSAGFDIDMDNWITGVEVQTGTVDPAVFLASPNAGAAFNPAGDPLVWQYVEAVSALLEGTGGNADEIASQIITEANDVTSFTLGVDRYNITQQVRPGAKIFVWDPIAQFFDFTQPAQTFNGEPIFPIEMDVSAVSWPIVEGMGVWLDLRHAGGGLHDITKYVQRDDVDTTSTVTIGKKPPVIGVGKRRYKAGGLQSVGVQNPPPDPPVANDDAFTTDYVTEVTGNVLTNDAGLDSIEVTDNTTPSHGDLTLGADGAMSYTPDVGFAGVDEFDYTITDEWGREATGTVAFNVIAPPGPTGGFRLVDPVTAGGADVIEAAPGVLADCTGTGITVTDFTPPPGGTMDLLSDGSFTYTPAPTPTVDFVDYVITDELGRVAEGRIDFNCV